MISNYRVLHQDSVLKKKKQLSPIRIWTRRSVITSHLLDKVIEVHNGKQFIKLKIGKPMLGHKLGEFAFTRKIYQYKKGKKR